MNNIFRAVYLNKHFLLWDVYQSDLAYVNESDWLIISNVFVMTYDGTR